MVFFIRRANSAFSAARSTSNRRLASAISLEGGGGGSPRCRGPAASAACFFRIRSTYALLSVTPSSVSESCFPRFLFRDVGREGSEEVADIPAFFRCSCFFNRRAAAFSFISSALVFLKTGAAMATALYALLASAAATSSGGRRFKSSGSNKPSARS